ncbi:MAG: hypothetical protein ACOCU6_01480 [Nanoarchaeota archaeon]
MMIILIACDFDDLIEGLWEFSSRNSTWNATDTKDDLHSEI